MTRCCREYRPCENSRVPRRCWLPQSAQLSEGLAQFGNEQLRLLKRGEVTAFRSLVPVEELRIGLVAPYLRRCKKVTFEDAHRNWQIDGHTGEILCETLKVNPCRGRGCVGQPVQANVIQHVIDRDGFRWITLVVAPRLKFLVDPHCLANRRVGKTVPECLGTGRLDRCITRTIGRIFAELSKRQLFCRRIAARRWRWRRKKNRKIQMNGNKPRNSLLGHPTRDSGAQIAALCYVVAVTEARHKRAPGVRNTRKSPAHFSWLVRKAKPRQGGDYDVKGFIGFTAMGSRVYERSDDLQKLDNRSGPSGRKYNRQSILVLRSDVKEGDPEPVNVRARLRQGIQRDFSQSPSVASAPAFN